MVATLNGAPTPRRVCLLICRPDARAHERASQRDVAQRLAPLLDAAYAGELHATQPSTAGAYFVPDATIASHEQALRFGIRNEDDLFGGVVPQPFVATKVISHARVDRQAAAPPGWSDDFGERVREVVLPGWSAFTRADALRAGVRLLAEGPLRLKPATGRGGLGQTVAQDVAELRAQLADLETGAIERDGIVLERNVLDARTYSIGTLRVGALRASYVGTQHNTRSRAGREVYGGSTIRVVRGGFDALATRVAHDAELRLVVALARRFHAAALDCFAGLLASRCNYDIVVGRDANARPLAGVLEQSWRIGGASGAEVAALRVLRDDPLRDSVKASTVERHGESLDAAPPGAIIGFAGVDPEAGPMLKYTLVHGDDDGA